MSPTLERDPETEEFVDWQMCARLESRSTLYEEQPVREKDPADGERLASARKSIWVIPSAPDSCHEDIDSELLAARELVALGDNWDGEGSSGYSLETWKRVKRFLIRHASASRLRFRALLPVPTISPADHGSLDLFWRLSDRQLLVNFPADENAPITYYGQNSQGNNTISGRTTWRERRLDLAAWLIQKTK